MASDERCLLLGLRRRCSLALFWVEESQRVSRIEGIFANRPLTGEIQHYVHPPVTGQDDRVAVGENLLPLRRTQPGAILEVRLTEP